MEVEEQRGAHLQVVPSDPEGEVADAMRRYRPFRIQRTLESDQSFTLAQTYGDLIALLRSGDPLDQELRNALAAGFERGQIEQKGCVRIKIEADGLHFKRISDAETLERRLQAGLFVAREKHKGLKPFEIRKGVEAEFSKQNAEEYIKSANKSYGHFRLWLEANYTKDDVFGWRPTNDIFSFEGSDEPEELDYFHEALSLYMMATSPAYVEQVND